MPTENTLESFTELRLGGARWVTALAGALYTASDAGLHRIHSDGALVGFPEAEVGYGMLAPGPAGTLLMNPLSKVERFDVTDRAMVDRWNVGSEGASAMLAGPDGKHCYAVNADTNCALRKYALGRSRVLKTFYLGRNAHLGWLDDHTLVAAETFAWSIDATTMKGRELGWLPARAASLVVWRDVVYIGVEHGVDVLDLADVTQPRRFWPGPSVRTLTLSADGASLLVGTDDGRLLRLREDGRAAELWNGAERSQGRCEVVSIAETDDALAWVASFQTDVVRNVWDSVSCVSALASRSA